jgi:hypothetical protein
LSRTTHRGGAQPPLAIPRVRGNRQPFMLFPRLFDAAEIPTRPPSVAAGRQVETRRRHRAGPQRAHTVGSGSGQPRRGAGVLRSNAESRDGIPGSKRAGGASASSLSQAGRLLKVQPRRGCPPRVKPSNPKVGFQAQRPGASASESTAAHTTRRQNLLALKHPGSRLDGAAPKGLLA